MEEQVINILNESITNEYFIPITIILILTVVIKSILSYKKYLRTCEIYNQAPNMLGYITNIVINIIAISSISVFAFAGYTGLSKSNEFEEKYKKSIEKNIKKENIDSKVNDTKKIKTDKKNIQIRKLQVENNRLKRQNKNLISTNHKLRKTNKKLKSMNVNVKNNKNKILITDSNEMEILRKNYETCKASLGVN